MASEQVSHTTLKRSLTLPLVTLYGLGVTIGAGIYVLVGVTAGRAGMSAPLAFIAAAFVMSFSAASYSELSGRLPVSAGEAAFVDRAFSRAWLSLAAGLGIVAAGVVSAAAICVGSVGYVQQFVPLPAHILIPLIVVLMTAIAAVGIMESVGLAAILTALEILGLIAVIAGGFHTQPDMLVRMPEVVEGAGNWAMWAGVLSAGVIAFFAFIGFEDIVNVAEEVIEPERTMPWAIGLTLVISTILYVLVAYVAVMSVPIETLAASTAPLSLLFSEVTAFPALLIAAIASLATLNGVIVQEVMASRVLYGLSNLGHLPGWLAHVHGWTRTPLKATLLIGAAILVLAMAVPLEALAEWTSRVTLSVFALVNGALIRIKQSEPELPAGVFRVPMWVPVAGLAACLGFLGSSFVL
ncbi:MAG: amino acid permease [Anderseniella sp.]|nr:amino acid permease [Anderseniella sp.]